jgi:hypothetical protein
MTLRLSEAAIPWIAVCALAAGAAHQAATALGWIAIGTVPGAWEPGHFLFLISLLVLLILCPALLAAAAVDHRVGGAPAIPLAAASVLVAHFESFDAYYAPTLRRMSDGGGVAGSCVTLVVACAIVAAACALRSNRLGTAFAGCVCGVAFGTAALASFGH